VEALPILRRVASEVGGFVIGARWFGNLLLSGQINMPDSECLPADICPTDSSDTDTSESLSTLELPEMSDILD